MRREILKQIQHWTAFSGKSLLLDHVVSIPMIQKMSRLELGVFRCVISFDANQGGVSKIGERPFRRGVDLCAAVSSFVPSIKQRSVNALRKLS